MQSETVKHTTLDGRTLDIPNVDHYRQIEEESK